MFRLSRVTNYGIVILAELARHRPEDEPAEPISGAPSLNARELAERADLPLPMVSKVLKALTRAGVLESQRGTKGGYSLARDPEELTVSAMAVRSLSFSKPARATDDRLRTTGLSTSGS